MTTFDLAEVRTFTADIDARLKKCDNGEGMGCSSIEGSLRHYATECRAFRAGVCNWALAVFGGRVAFDAEVEEFVLSEGRRLLGRAVAKADYADRMEHGCYMLEGRIDLRDALKDLARLLNPWVRPQLSVGPAARCKLILSTEQKQEINSRIATLRGRQG